MGRKRASVLAAVVLASLAVASTAHAHGDEGHGVHVVPPGATVRGANLATWAGRWAQAMLSEPTVTNPLVHPELCSLPGPGGVRLMGASVGGVATVRCRFRDEQQLLFTAGGWICDEPENGITSAADLRACVRSSFRQIVSRPLIRVDGRRVSVHRRLVTSPRFFLHLTADNVLGAPAGSYPAMMKGWFAFVEVSEGRHVVVTRDVLDPPGADPPFIAQMRFVIDVAD